MKSSLLDPTLLLALLPAVVGGAAAGADATGSVDRTTVDRSGPRGCATITEITPEVHKEFPLLGSMSSKFSTFQFAHGTPELDGMT